MFPIEFEVTVRQNNGQVQRYALLENQGDRHLIVVHPSVIKEMMAYLQRGGRYDDGLIALLVDEAMVIDRKKGTPLPLAEANKVLARSKNPSLRQAAVFRGPMPDRQIALNGEDLAWAFGLELAKRRLAS